MERIMDFILFIIDLLIKFLQNANLNFLAKSLMIKIILEMIMNINLMQLSSKLCNSELIMYVNFDYICTSFILFYSVCNETPCTIIYLQRASEVQSLKRTPQQRYILYTHKSAQNDFVPPLINKNFLAKYFKKIDANISVELMIFNKFRNFFNWTWTFREDSDIKENFGPIYVKKSTKLNFETFAPKGTKLEL